MLGRGRGFHSPLISLFVYKKNDLTVSQFSFLSSKKVSKLAVKRNALRRAGYESVGKAISKIQPGFYFVFNFKKGADLVSSKEIHEQVQVLFVQAGVIQ